MKLSEGVEWTVHCCALLANLPKGTALPAKKLAVFFDIPEHYLAKHMQQMSIAGIVATKKGPGGGYRLAKPATSITLLDMVEAIDGRTSSFRCTEIRRRGPTGLTPCAYKMPCGIARTMKNADKIWREELAKTTIADIQMMGVRETPKEQIEKTVDWMKEILL
jgi:Rrf2 family protein